MIPPRLSLATCTVVALLAIGLTWRPQPAEAMSGMAMKALCGDVSPGAADAAGARQHREEGDQAFKARATPAQADKAIAAYEASLVADGAQPEVRVRLARLYYLLGDGRHRFAEDDDAQLEAFKKGAAQAGAALALLNPTFKSRLCGNAPVRDALAVLDRRSVPAIYWFASNLGKYGLAKDIIELLANKDMIFEAMSACQRLWPDYFHHAPDRYLGAYYAKVPFPQGDPARSLAHFQRSMRGERRYFATYVLTAEMYALRLKDRVPAGSKWCRIDRPGKADSGATVHPCERLYLQLLKHVVATPAAVLPEIEAEQRVEQEKAKRLLQDADTYFPPAS